MGHCCLKLLFCRSGAIQAAVGLRCCPNRESDSHNPDSAEQEAAYCLRVDSNKVPADKKVYQYYQGREHRAPFAHAALKEPSFYAV